MGKLQVYVSARRASSPIDLHTRAACLGLSRHSTSISQLPSQAKSPLQSTRPPAPLRQPQSSGPQVTFSPARKTPNRIGTSPRWPDQKSLCLYEWLPEHGRKFSMTSAVSSD